MIYLIFISLFLEEKNTIGLGCEVRATFDPKLHILYIGKSYQKKQKDFYRKREDKYVFYS